MTLETVLKNFTDYVNLGCVLFETVHEYGMENIIRLDYYSEALSRLEKKEVAEVLIYSFSLGEVIKV